MYYSYVEIEYVATSFSPARTDLALKLLTASIEEEVDDIFSKYYRNTFFKHVGVDLHTQI